MRIVFVLFTFVAASSCVRARPNVVFASDDLGERCHKEADRAFRACLADKTAREVCEDAQDALLLKCGGDVQEENEAITVKTSEELGHLNVVRSYGVKYTRSFVLEYTNDTADVLRKVRLECSVIDVRGVVVNTGSLEIPEAQPGATTTRILHVLDSVNRAATADCRIAVAQRGA
ncbi:MAG: hypothetical protein DI536_06265 [Archangium gephyra]|uniref:Lipoprotein n=1 Tax=Archangium gephyra TaxID=48 RepID=A0A2W5VLM1_9BACT|nr:MAG: hypothetical protein DI536_06265 [Archangium gephyra]